VRPRQNQVRRGRRYALAALGLTLALCCGLAGGASAAVAATPPAPTDLTATAVSGFEIDLSWDAPTAPSGLTLAGYDVYQGTSPGGESGTPVNPSALITGTSYSVTDLNNGTTYYFDVIAIYQAFEGGGIPSAASAEASATTGPGPAPAPGDLTATAAGSAAVDLTWGAPVAPFALPLLGYDVYQGTGSGGESATPVNSVPVTANSYTVTGLASGTTYYFEVTAVYRDGQSPASPEASATTTANVSGTPAPQVVSFAPIGSRVVGVSFAVAASASSGLPVSFASDTPHVCSVTGSIVTTLAAGQCDIQAAQAGNADFQPAAVIQDFSVSAAVGPTAGTTPTAGSGGGPTPSARSTPSSGGGPTASSRPTASGGGPGGLVTILLAVAVALLAGVLALLAARLSGVRRGVRSRPPAPQAARIKAEPQPGPPPAVHIRVTGTDATHAVRIEPDPGTRRTTIEEVRS
jgi:hypothetical protein